MPATVNPTCYHESASSIAAFQKCPVLFRLSYREGLRPAEDTESQRQGTMWHKMHETYANLIQNQMKHGPCRSDEERADAALMGVIGLLNERYVNNDKPNYLTVEEWALERQILLTSFIGYLWYYQDDPIEFLASEVPFNLPVYMPRTGLPLPMGEVQRVGKIDHLIRWRGMVGVLERKSTTRSIEEGSDYWSRSQKDTQVSMYASAVRELVMQPGGLPAFHTDRLESIGNTLYDVWHKPTTKPKMLTQADTKQFLVSDEYFGRRFITTCTRNPRTPGDDNGSTDALITVDGEPTEVEPGKKGFAIRESVGMYGARLLADIYERPTFYFVRREIARTDEEIAAFRDKVYSIYQTKKLIEKNNTWFENEGACRATFPCPMIPICYSVGHKAVCDGKTIPNGYKRIYQVTVNDKIVEEE